MMPARWARGATTTWVVTGTLLATVGALAGCASLPSTAQPVAAAPAAAAPAAPAAAAEPCPFLTWADVEQLVGDQLVSLVGSANTCSFAIGGQFTYQIDVFSNDVDRFNTERNKFYQGSMDLVGVGDEAFYKDGTGLTTIGVCKANTFFTVNLLPVVADPNGGGGTAPVVTPPDPQKQAQNDADVNGDGVVDADLDGDTVIDDDADPDAIAAADVDDDGTVDDGVLVTVEDAAAQGGGPVTDMAGAKAAMTTIAVAVASNLP